jgi:hypothetical protein
MASEIEKPPVAAAEESAAEPKLHTLPSGVNDVGALPKGQLDPVYEAKAESLTTL